MTKIDFNVYDLHIKTLDDGREIVQLRPHVSFNEQMVKSCKEMGVQNEYKTEE